ncbi:hypothetical protein COJ27_29865 [Bacillus cereus]|uniref:radical SAM/SPASM domain-containing protein n=1 Tax=Bacillus cereus TaxID=1396 RepID=UPI000BFA2F63|nr:radical SAM protein [Bacillus cereus]PFL57210.1 hypothetical protein COJ27_29865 [Bacillus cereus]
MENISELIKPTKIFKILSEREYGNNMPVSVEIQPTNICNYDCDYCSYSIRKSNRKFLKREACLQLCDDLIKMQVKTVYFSGGGDPTMYPYLAEMMHKLHKSGVKLALLTNGSNSKLLLEVAKYCEYILIHISSHKPDIYEVLMGKKMNDILNIAQRIQNTLKGNIVKVGARIVVVEKNQPYLADTVKELLAKNFDYVQCTPAADYESISEKSNLNQMKQIANDPVFKLPGVTFNLKNSTDYNAHLTCASIENKLHATIDALGGVYICPPYTAMQGDFCLGNINNNNFYEIWESENHKKVIDKMNRRYKDNKCKNCRFISYNPHIEDYKNAHKNPHSYFL